MGKARMYGMKTAFIPNSKENMRFRQKIYRKNRQKIRKNTKEAKA